MQSTVSCDRPVRSLAHMILSRCARAEPATPPSQGLRPGYAAELGDTAEHLVAVPADDDPMSRRCAGLAKDGCRLPAVASTCPHPSRTTNRWIARPAHI